MTICEELGYKVGDKFEVVSETALFEYGFKLGQVITLYRDDGSYSPLFKGANWKDNLCDGKEGTYMSLDRVKPLKAG